MRTDQLDYDLPADLIAQRPAEPRDAARLLMYDRGSGVTRHGHFRNLIGELRNDDIVAVNATRVLPVRVRARRPTGGMAEVLLIEPRGDGVWEALARPARKLTPGIRLVAGGGLEIEIVERLEGGRMLVRPLASGPLEDALRGAGEMPLPPYIDRGRPDDPERYQTVYARTAGSVAAPTAGLHFTPGLLDGCAAAGVEHVTLTLHVGPGTFLPIRGGDLAGYRMAPGAVRAAARHGGPHSHGARRRRAGGRRRHDHRPHARVGGRRRPARRWDGEAGLFIQPGHRFQVVDALLTNFHLPRTPLLALVAAFAGWERVREAYARGGTATLPLLQLRRRHADHVVTPPRASSCPLPRGPHHPRANL